MNLTQAIEQKVGNNNFPTKTRIRVGKLLTSIALLPIGTSPLFLLSIPMSITLSPSLWAKDKIRYFNEWRMLNGY